MEKYNPLSQIKANRGTIFTTVLFIALFAFEVFNFTTTEYSLQDVLGRLSFLGIPWATLLTTAFCLLDLAGLARMFTPEQGDQEPAEVWYLFGAWVLAAAMNASLTWWGVAVAIASNTTSQSASLMGREKIQAIVPVFVAILVFVIRILIIGTLSVSADKKQAKVYSRPSSPVTVISKQTYPPAKPASQSAKEPNYFDKLRPSNNTTFQNGRPISSAQNSRPVRSTFERDEE